MNPGSAASLRWRSRLAHEAVHQDDSRVVVVQEDYGLNGDQDDKKGRFGWSLSSFVWKSSSSSSHATRGTPGSSVAVRFSRLWSILAMVTAAVSLAVIEVDLAWATAVTSALNVFLSAVVLVAVRRLTILGSVRQQVRYGQQRVHALSQQNERLYRTLARLDNDQNRLEAVRHDLQKLVAQKSTTGNGGTTTDVDTARLLRVVQRWRVVQAAMNRALAAQVQNTILEAVLHTDRDANFTLSAPEFERLLVRLQNMPGVCINETALRLQWERQNEDDDDDNHHHQSLPAILSLLRQITEDANDDANQGGRTTKSGVHGTRGMATSSSAIVQLDAKALYQASRQQQQQQHGDLITL